MNRIINVPIEPLDERYTEQWWRWFPQEFNNLRIPYITIKGQTLTSSITRGCFLDAVSTNYYKASQLKVIMEMFHRNEVTSDDVFLFNDYWFPGLEMLAYVRDTLGLSFRIAGWLHAGTYDPWDFLAQRRLDRWGRELENSWFKIADILFFNSFFHKNLAMTTREVDSNKAFAMGSVVYKEFDDVVDKKNIVVFPHRLNIEKQPELFDDIAGRLKVRFPDWEFIKTQEVKRDKNTYNRLLASAKIAVSCNLQETFGLAMVESVMYGCIPIVPERLSYRELYDDYFKYPDESMLYDKLVSTIMNVDTILSSSRLRKQQEYFTNTFATTIKRICDIVFGVHREEYPTYEQYVRSH